jgi:hypothetical protein
VIFVEDALRCAVAALCARLAIFFAIDVSSARSARTRGSENPVVERRLTFGEVVDVA